MNIAALHRKAVDDFTAKVRDVSADQWDQPTPCSEWDVRTLVNHLVYEQRWTKPLVDGRTMDDVGAAFEGDLLGDDPVAAIEASSTEASEAVDERVPAGEIVHLSFGDVPIEEYVMQLTADHLIHGWDLAAATGMHRTMEPELVAVVSNWFASQEEMFRSVGVIGPRTEAGGDPESDLLAAYGRDSNWSG